MRVLCIDGTTDVDSSLPVDVTEGEVYHVNDEFTDPTGQLWYYLEERSPNNVYHHSGFIPLTDDDDLVIEVEVAIPLFRNHF